MTDSFVPEADAAEQAQEVVEPAGRPAVPSPSAVEANEADVLEQAAEVPDDDERDRI